METLAMDSLGDFNEELAAAAAFQAFGAEGERPSGFDIDAPAFVPTCAASGGLSAEAPVFVPGQKSMALDQKFTNNSDVSTVDGESESDEEKAAVVVTA